MSKESSLLRWSSSFTVTAPGRTPKLPGDKITLPQSALEQLLAAAPLQEVFSNRPAHPYTTAFDPLNPRTFAAESRAREQALERQHQLPHPLTFRIVNPKNGRAIYAGIREFSAEDNEVGLSVFLRDALGIEDNQFPSETSRYWQTSEPSEAIDATTEPLPASLAPELAPIVTVHVEQLPKGTYVRLRPLEAGYDPEDWKALLERYLRDNFTTLSTGEVLQVSGGRHESFRFLVDKIEPDGDGICIIDTDLEVDIVALTEDQARETYQRRLEKASRAIGTQGDSSTGGVLSIGEKVNGLVVPGTYVDYEIREWDRGEPIVITVESADDADVFLFISPLTARQRNRPREDQHLLGDFTTQPIKCIQIESTNVELETAEALYVSVYAFGNFEYSEEHSQKQELPLQYKLQISTSHSVGSDGDSKETLAHGNPNEIQCGNCQQWVPQQTLVLHESFCLRNNVLCPQCHNVFQKRSSEWQNHWHCPHDSSYGNDFAKKPILCQFCHLVVPQKGETDPDMHDPEVLVSGLTPHELVDGGRTTECHLCNKIVRLRDMKTHLRHHDLERLSKPPPRVCMNQNCGRTLDGRSVQNAATPGTDTLGLCSFCFGPLYVDTYDPEGKALRRRIERRYLSQMMTGCGKAWCQNEYCKNGRRIREPFSIPKNDTPLESMSVANILATIKPFVDAICLQSGSLNTAPFYFCADQVGQQRRILAEMIAAEGSMASSKGYDLPWCVASVEATGGDLSKAREWLENWAPAKDEEDYR
ncbi:ubiquitin fusion degradation protein UFD1-domain-containing protein [Aspergillus pseudonomiae]|uniref:Ubiquitin fusion degradation protein UFD1-domain-containing protein n=1 Tax=Aspergillus pseudonomiae TaxID=1506151 RepID=A0A5N7DB71_9EURO|nr:ubiquitin fusion degradation protein UFD1-domain-containing protein [Aspergillus pseudonomiae]KAE8403597.1 ubiquitin fusion degradation protein UFD1-domain-containing protein [Aspergillus pseudonomiae]